MMAIKHVREYYDQITEQYNEMLSDLKEAEQDLENNLVDVDYVENVRKCVQPIKDSYMAISWIMFLLNQPAKKPKIPKYKSQLKAVTDKLDARFSTEETLKSNRQCLDELTEQSEQ